MFFSISPLPFLFLLLLQPFQLLRPPSCSGSLHPPQCCHILKNGLEEIMQKVPACGLASVMKATKASALKQIKSYFSTHQFDLALVKLTNSSIIATLLSRPAVGTTMQHQAQLHFFTYNHSSNLCPIRLSGAKKVRTYEASTGLDNKAKVQLIQKSVLGFIEPAQLPLKVK